MTKNTVTKFGLNLLIYIALLTAYMFIFDRSMGLVPYSQKLAAISVGVGIGCIITRSRYMLELWYFRGILLIVGLTCIALPSLLALSEELQNTIFLGGLAFVASSSGYYLDYHKPAKKEA